ncbi:MAG: short-chain dehydrogenase, partial [Dehalococcoidia bacterium]|nr:short-chain dehydrogenase [Dehalococcoidia bacterium]
MTPRALEDRVAIVTEAGRGLGRLLALELARQGARVLVNHHGTEHGSSPPGDISLASATAWEIHDAGGLGGASAHDTNTPEGAHAAV